MPHQEKRQPSDSSKIDPFERFFSKVEESSRYWEELARIEFTELVVARMHEISLKKSELAEKLNVHPSFVTRLLSGNNNFELATMVRIARALDCEFRSHLQPSGTQVMWINVLKEEPDRRPNAGWPQFQFETLKSTKTTYVIDESIPIAA